MINMVGTITKIIATDDSEVFETETLEGYHVNSTEEIEAAKDYLIDTPDTPYNLFFGIPVESTFFYVFSNEEECREVLGVENED